MRNKKSTFEEQMENIKSERVREILQKDSPLEIEKYTLCAKCNRCYDLIQAWMYFRADDSRSKSPFLYIVVKGAVMDFFNEISNSSSIFIGRREEMREKIGRLSNEAILELLEVYYKLYSDLYEKM